MYCKGRNFRRKFNFVAFVYLKKYKIKFHTKFSCVHMPGGWLPHEQLIADGSGHPESTYMFRAKGFVRKCTKFFACENFFFYSSCSSLGACSGLKLESNHFFSPVPERALDQLADLGHDVTRGQGSKFLLNAEFHLFSAIIRQKRINQSHWASSWAHQSWCCKHARRGKTNEQTPNTLPSGWVVAKKKIGKALCKKWHFKFHEFFFPILGFLASWLLGFLVSWFLGFLVLLFSFIASSEFIPDTQKESAAESSY